MTQSHWRDASNNYSSWPHVSGNYSTTGNGQYCKAGMSTMDPLTS